MRSSDESLTCYSESDGRVSLAYEKLKEIPVWVAENFANHTHTLDLSFNNIKYIYTESVKNK